MGTDITLENLEQDLNNFFIGKDATYSYGAYIDVSHYIEKNYFPIFAKDRKIGDFTYRKDSSSYQSFFILYKNKQIAYITIIRKKIGTRYHHNEYTFKKILVRYLRYGYKDLESALVEIDTESNKVNEYKQKVNMLAQQVYQDLLEKLGDKSLAIDVIKEISNNSYKY